MYNGQNLSVLFFFFFDTYALCTCRALYKLAYIT